MLPAGWAMLATSMQDRTLHLTLGTLVLLALIASAIAPYDRATWLLEVAPVLIAAPVLLLSHRSFPLTRLLYVVIAIHALILILGGTYTYARVPPGFWVQEWFDLSRNPYDKLGHFIQGVTPALLAREILLRLRFVVPGKMLGFLAVCVALAERVVGGAAGGTGRRGLPRHPGRSLGYPVRHAHGAARCATVGQPAGGQAGPADRASAAYWRGGLTPCSIGSVPTPYYCCT